MSRNKSQIEINVLDRVKEAYNLPSDTDLANFLEVGQSTVANWRKRNSFNLELIISKCNELNFNWLINGQGPIWKKDLEENQVKEPTSDYLPASLRDYEQKAIEIVNKIEHGPWHDDVKLQLIDTILAIVERDLEKLNSET